MKRSRINNPLLALEDAYRAAVRGAIQAHEALLQVNKPSTTALVIFESLRAAECGWRTAVRESGEYELLVTTFGRWIAQRDSATRQTIDQRLEKVRSARQQAERYWKLVEKKVELV